MTPTPAGLSWPTRLLVAGGVAAAVGATLVGPRTAPWLIGAAAACLGLVGYELWYRHLGPGKIIAALVAHWAQLPGSTVGRDRVAVHDGTWPLEIRLGKTAGALWASVLLRLPGSALAFKIWPESQATPGYHALSDAVGGPPVQRAVELEALFVGLLRIDTNDPRALRAVLDQPLVAALLSVRKASAEAFAGVTFDGTVLGIHWQGPTVAQPERTLQLSRPLWRAVTGA